MEDFNKEIGKFNANGFTPIPTRIETEAIADSIRSSYTNPKPQLPPIPKDLTPENNLFFRESVGGPEKASFETKNYNVEDAYQKLNSGEYIKKYDSYKVGRNNEEYAAQTQSTAEKWGNGFAKFAGKIGTGIVGGTVGILDGIYEGVKQGSFRATYDNQFLNYLDDLNEKLDYKLPNHYTQAEKDASFLGSMGTANFWANDVLGGAAFTVSAIGSEAIWDYATGGAALATSAARLGAKAERAFGKGSRITKGLEAMAEAKSLATKPVLQTYLNAKLPTQYASAFGKAAKMANVARFTYTSAGFESGMEARQYIREMKNNYVDDFQSKNGRMPSDNELSDFNENLTNSANALYGFNMAIVGSSNLMTIGKIYDIKSPLGASSKWANSKLFGIGITEEGGKMVAQTATKFQKAAQYAWGMGESALVEGVWEEGMQSVGSNTAKNWIKSTYDPKYLKNTIGLSEAFTQGLSDTYGTKEGMKEVGIGMLIGLLTGVGINMKTHKTLRGEFASKEDEAKHVENFYASNYSPNKLSETLAYSGRMQAANEQGDKAADRGDFTGGELARQSAILAQISHAHNLEYLDETVQQTEAGIKNIGNDMLMKEYGVDEQGAEDIKKKLIDEYKGTAETYKKNRNFTEYYVSNDLTKEEQEKLGTTSISAVKDAIAYELTLGEKVHGFSQDLLASLKDEVKDTFIGEEVSSALTIEDILLKAGKDTRKEAVAKERQMQTLEKKRLALEQEYKAIENTLNDKVTPEARKAALNKIDATRIQITQIEEQKEQLTKEYNVLIKTANLKNPFGDKVQDLIVTSTTLQNRENSLQRIKELVKEHKGVAPQQSARLEKLVSEYGKSIYAFKRYADLARQLSDPSLGLRGKRNIISELGADKSPNAMTVEFLDGIIQSLEDRNIEEFTNRVENAEPVKEVLNKKEEEQKPTADSIKKPSREEKQAKRNEAVNKITEEYDAKIAELGKETETPESKEVKPTDKGVEQVKKNAQEYKDSLENTQRSSPIVTKLFSKVSKMISDAYEKIIHQPKQEDVAIAYEALVQETAEQYDFIVSKGLKIIRHTGKGEPYANSQEMLNDLEKGQLIFLPNVEAFGEDAAKVTDNIGLEPSGRKLEDGYELTNSEVFRVVHDYFGHGILGNEFGKVGEENATLQHLDLYSDVAAPAVVFQTRGQNSWVNFSGVNDKANELRTQARELRKQGKNEEADKLVEEANNLFKFAEPKIAIFPNKYNFKRYETARRINDQEEIDNRTNPRDNEIPVLLERYSNGSRSTRGVNKGNIRRTEVIRGNAVTVVADYTLDDKINEGLKKAFPNFKGVQKIYEITDGEIYRNMMVEALKDQKHKASVTVHSVEDFNKMRMFITEDGSTGVTLTKDGFLGGAFSDPNFKRPANLGQLLILGIKEGGITGEAYDTILPDYYAAFGLKAVSRTAFNEELKPTIAKGALADWDEALYQKWNNGKPDIVFFIYDGGSKDTIEDRVGLFDSYKSYEKGNTKAFDKDSYSDAQKEMHIQAIKRAQYEEASKPEEKVEAKPVDNSKEIAALEKEKQDKIAEVDKRYNFDNSKLAEVKTTIKAFISETIKNSPYLLEYYGSDVSPEAPTEAEIQEFEELANRAINDPKIDNKTISFKSPYGNSSLPQTGKNLNSLSKEETLRLQDLNERLANWKLLEVYGSKDGVSVADMVMQDLATKQEVSAKENYEVTDNDYETVINTNPSLTDTGAEIRNGEILQTYENVFVSESNKGVAVSHLTLKGLLARLEVSAVRYEATEVRKNKEFILDIKEAISPEELETLAKPGAKFTVIESDGSVSVIRIDRGGKLLFKDKSQYQQVFQKAGLEAKNINFGETGGYTKVTDLRANQDLQTDYEDANTYKPYELYNMLPGEPVVFQVDLANSYNLALIEEYQTGLEEGAKTVEQLDKDLMDNIKISTLDYSGNKLSDLKANYDIQNNPEFLKVRLAALNIAKNAIEKGSLGEVIEVPLQTQIKYVFLGTPNLDYDEEGKIKFFPIEPKKVVTYGYIENGKLVLKDNKGGKVRQDYIKKFINKNGTPVVVFEQGKYLVAFPAALVKSDVKLGDTFLQEMSNQIEQGGKNLAKVSLDLNQLLVDNGLPTSRYNLHFLDSDNQTLFDEEGNMTKNLSNAIEDLNKVPQVADVKTWITSEHTKEDLANEATMPVDITNNPLSSPKPIIDLADGALRERVVDWVSQYLTSQDISEEKATEIVDKFISNTLSTQEYETLDHPKVAEKLKELSRMNPEFRSKVETVLGKLEDC